MANITHLNKRRESDPFTEGLPSAIELIDAMESINSIHEVRKHIARGRTLYCWVPEEEIFAKSAEARGKGYTDLKAGNVYGVEVTEEELPNGLRGTKNIDIANLTERQNLWGIYGIHPEGRIDGQYPIISTEGI